MQRNPLVLPSIFIVSCVLLAGAAVIAHYYEKAAVPKSASQLAVDSTEVVSAASLPLGVPAAAQGEAEMEVLSAAAPLVLADSESPVVVEYAATTITTGSGESNMVAHQVLRVRRDGAYHAIFPTSTLYTVKHYEVSPAGRFIVIETGDVAGDAAVRLWVYDTQTQTLECVRVADKVCGEYNGFPTSESITTGWFVDDRLWINFDNPFLPAGATEEGGAVGRERFESQNAATPWLITAVTPLP